MFVQELMTREPATVGVETHVKTAVDLLARRRVSSLPVVDDEERVVGIISRSDVILTRARADHDVADDVDSLLGELGHEDWLVEVQEGAVQINGPRTALDRSIAEVAANTVPGVVAVEVREP
jgi:CBS domain-containing protein